MQHTRCCTNFNLADDTVIQGVPSLHVSGIRLCVLCLVSCRQVALHVCDTVCQLACLQSCYQQCAPLHTHAFQYSGLNFSGATPWRYTSSATASAAACARALNGLCCAHVGQSVSGVLALVVVRQVHTVCVVGAVDSSNKPSSVQPNFAASACQ